MDQEWPNGSRHASLGQPIIVGSIGEPNLTLLTLNLRLGMVSHIVAQLLEEDVAVQQVESAIEYGGLTDSASLSVLLYSLP